MSGAGGDAETGSIKHINLALQGGGAHGAYSWGVLDRLLEDPRIAIEAVSGTSAGAMNAAVLVAGLAAGGPSVAREVLDEFWHQVSLMDRFSPIRRTFWEKFSGGYTLDGSPGLAFMETLSRTFSPYQVNPMNLNPLRGILEKLIDFETLQHADSTKLFISATNVSTGRARIFENHEMTPDVLLASACLPQMFQAVEIDGEHFWDGGYMGNPAIYPLIYGAECRDVVLVQINPLERVGVPKSAREIQNRINEISFNASLIHEMRAIHFVTRLIDDGELDSKNYKRMLMHMIEAEDALETFGASSKLNADWDFLSKLKGIGCEAAENWLDKNFEMLGEDSTIDLQEHFL